METQVGKWGNSLAVRIPLAFARAMEIEEGGTVELTLTEGRLVLVRARPRYDLDELIADITPENRHAEADWGGPEGAEAW